MIISPKIILIISTIIIVVLIIIVGENSKKRTLKLKQLQKNKSIDFYIISEPIIAISSKDKNFYLIYHNKKLKYQLGSISRITLTESKKRGNHHGGSKRYHTASLDIKKNTDNIEKVNIRKIERPLIEIKKELDKYSIETIVKERR